MSSSPRIRRARALRLATGCALAALLAFALVVQETAAQKSTARKTTRITGPQLLDMIQRGQLAEAEKILKQQIDRQAELRARGKAAGKAHARILFLYGQVLHQQFRHGEAEPYLREALQAEPGRIGWLEILAEGLLRQGRCKAAIVVLERALKLDPRPRFHFNIAMCAGNTGDLERAQGELRQALASGGDDPRTLYKLGALLADQGRNQEALDLLRRAVAGDPGNVEARFALGLAESRAGNHPAAAATFRRVRAEVAGHAGATYNLGHTLARLDQREESRAVLVEFQELSKKDDLIDNHLQYVQLNATDPEPRIALAKLLLEVGRISQAVEQLEAARGLDPQQLEVHQLLTQGYLLLGRAAEARQADGFAAQLKP